MEADDWAPMVDRVQRKIPGLLEFCQSFLGVFSAQVRSLKQSTNRIAPIIEPRSRLRVQWLMLKGRSRSIFHLAGSLFHISRRDDQCLLSLAERATLNERSRSHEEHTRFNSTAGYFESRDKFRFPPQSN